jgi:large conductance mechanosensitive channel
MIEKKNIFSYVKSKEHQELIKESIKKRTRIFGEFREFLKKYNILALAIAFVLGAAANTLVKSLVDNIIMPLITPAIPNGKWEEAMFNIGTIQIKWGPVLSELIHFLILAWIIFLIIKFVDREEKK